MRHLTKSRFILATECPTKLRFCDDPAYASSKADNEYLKALAEGGHQVGALATTLFPDGIAVEEAGHAAQLIRTGELMARESVALFEAAFGIGRRFVRVDLLRKQGNRIELYEVKAKSFDPTKGVAEMLTKRGLPKAGWAPYFHDLLYQRELVREAYPGCTVTAHLVLVKKTAPCPVEGANQKLRIIKSEAGRVRVEIDPSLKNGELARALLSVVPLDDVLEQMLEEPLQLGRWEFAYREGVSWVVDALDAPPKPRPGAQCKQCEFRASPEARAEGRLDGWSTCWREAFSHDAPASPRDSILALYSYRGVDSLVEARTLALQAVERSQLGPEGTNGAISLADRQWLQCEEARQDLPGPHLVKAPLRAALEGVRYPLHFIDFENAAPAIPFRQGRRPYEVELFQFSHHQMESDGRLRHVGQALEVEGGADPNLAVLRALMAQLGRDDGTVIHWWTHERTVLSKERSRLLAMEDPPHDRDSLVAFIDGMIGSEGGQGRLLDLGQHVVHRYVFLPGTSGRSSIKVVLPAVIALSSCLQTLYEKPTYGAPEGVPSLNFQGQQWIVRNPSGSGFLDPYDLLGERFDDPDLAGSEDLEGEEGAVQDGGAAMVAYGLLQNIGLSADRRESLKKQLLRYCELDTLAMVMVWQALPELLGDE